MLGCRGSYQTRGTFDLLTVVRPLAEFGQLTSTVLERASLEAMTSGKDVEFIGVECPESDQEQHDYDYFSPLDGWCVLWF